MLDDFSQPGLVDPCHVRLPDDLGHADALDVEVQLRVVFEALEVVRIEWIVGGEAPDEGVEEFVLAQGDALRGVIEREGRVVLEQAGFGLLEEALLVFLIVRFFVPLWRRKRR